MAFYKDERLALFIDGANLYSAARAVGLEIDFRKLLKEFQNRGRLIRANYYTALVENDDYSPIRPLVDWLDYNGFSMVTKAARSYTDATGRKKWRGDMKIEMAVDVMEMAAHADQRGVGDERRRRDPGNDVGHVSGSLSACPPKPRRRWGVKSSTRRSRATPELSPLPSPATAR